MEGSFEEWIIYGVVLLISIIGMVRKAKLQAQKTNNMPAPTPAAPSFPWLEELEDQQPAPQPIIPAWQTSSPAEVRALDNIEASGGEAMREMVATEGGRSTRDKYHSKNHLQENAQAELHPLMEDFDLRKAVLYSEILKPRYDQY